MAKRRSAALIKADEFHAKVVELLQTRHADWSEWEETFLLDNAQRPRDFIYSSSQWAVLVRLVCNATSIKQYNGYSVQELWAIAYAYRLDLDEDDEAFLETLKRWEPTDLKRRQIRRLAGIARLFEPIGYDELDYVGTDEDSEFEKLDLGDVLEGRAA